MDANIDNKTERYIQIYFTTLMVVLIGFIGDLYWVGNKLNMMLNMITQANMVLFRLHVFTLGKTC